jgi:hypothetical protein
VWLQFWLQGVIMQEHCFCALGPQHPVLIAWMVVHLEACREDRGSWLPCAARMSSLTALVLCGGGVNCSAAHKRTALGQRIERVDHVS